MGEKAHDPIPPWFIAAEELGEYIGIRFGRIPPRSEQPEWIFLRHAEFDGIGGFAELLRRRDATLPRLPQVKHPSNPSWLPLIRSIPKFLRPRRPLKWGPLSGKTAASTSSKPPPAVSWHVFDENTTTQIRRACRRGGFTVNSFLLKHLTKAIRPSLHDESSDIPWMLPVNLRGKVLGTRDTANFSSFVGIKVRTFETVHDIHQNIYGALARREHWANWYSYKSGPLLGAALRRYLVATGKGLPEWYLGGFSNLGDWDAEKRINQLTCQGAWLFCPPVLRCQMIGAGCVTFQNQLSLTLHVHPELTTDSAVPQAWVQNWVKEIDLDLSSVLPDPLAVPSLAF